MRFSHAANHYPMHHFLFTALTMLVLSGCGLKPLQVRPPDELASAPALSVTGRQGWQLGRELRFGDFSTKLLQGGSVGTRSASCPTGCTRLSLGPYVKQVDEASSKSRSRLSFTLLGPLGVEVEVRAVGELDQQRRESLTRWFGVSTDISQELSRSISFIGTIDPAPAEMPGWRFEFRESSPTTVATGAYQGRAEDERGRRLLMRSLSRWQGDDARGTAFMPALHLGYAFELDGRVVAAVDTATGGTVWMRPGLAADLRLAIAGLAMALLARSDLSSQPAPALRR